MSASLTIDDNDATAGVMYFGGDWLMSQPGGLPDMTRVTSLIKQQQITSLRVDLSDVKAWDTSLVAVINALRCLSAKHNIAFECQYIPEGIANLLKLAAQPCVRDSIPPPSPAPLEQLGRLVLYGKASTDRILTFIGEITLSVLRLSNHVAYFRKTDFLEIIAESGPRALPIVTLIAFLVGLVLAFVGSMQLEEFGAQIFVANLVSVAMAREMGAMMTAIILAGRTSASYAARIGTMQVNEEIDALRTSGILPMDFLVLPRILALLITVPILCFYANAVGIIGGMAIGVFMLDLSLVEYWHQTVEAVSLDDFGAGLIKSVIFALVIGIAGCYHGLRCGRSSEAVGKITTIAVVSAIVFIVITDALLTVIYDITGL